MITFKQFLIEGGISETLMKEIKKLPGNRKDFGYYMDGRNLHIAVVWRKDRILDKIVDILDYYGYKFKQQHTDLQIYTSDRYPLVNIEISHINQHQIEYAVLNKLRFY